MSCLGGRARSWAYGRRLTDHTCFSTYEVFKEELRQAFEPPQNEFRSRTEFLELQQGKHDVYAYAQRSRYLVSNVVTNPIYEATKVVTFMKGLKNGPVKTYLFTFMKGLKDGPVKTYLFTFMKGLKDGPVKTYLFTFMKGLKDGPVKACLFREYPMRRLLDPSSVVGQRMFVISGVETTVTMPVSSQRLCTRPRADMTIPGIATGSKKTKAASRRGTPAGDAVERVDIGHAVSKTAPREIHSHCKKRDDNPNLVILKVNSKRERSLRALVDCGASNNFVRLQSLARLDFEEFVDELIVLDLDDKLDMVLGMPWLARHDPVIDSAKRTIVRFGSSGATESDGPVGAAHAPRGACDPPVEAARGATASDLSARTLTTERVVGEKCEPNQKTQIRSDLRGSRSVKGDAIVSTVDTQVEPEEPVTDGSGLCASAPGADAISPNMKGRSAVRRRGKRGASAPGADAATRQAAQVSVRDRDATSRVCRADTATGDKRRDTECLDAFGYWSPVSEDGAREPSDASVGVDFTSSYELEAFRPRPARWTHRADLHPLGRREDEK
ncbi:unnamed protein product [Phytophthora fragariaefolia]|uniref:Unnamed protein product n=1 Tax=Phytophthora fragariaefolia TaxID=1490495 RepID=A0A9W6Y5Q7_9STRA|nr:unnamed protein product [Phytophthora fragariaefolia]